MLKSLDLHGIHMPAQPRSTLQSIVGTSLLSAPALVEKISSSEPSQTCGMHLLPYLLLALFKKHNEPLQILPVNFLPFGIMVSETSCYLATSFSFLPSMPWHPRGTPIFSFEVLYTLQPSTNQRLHSGFTKCWIRICD